MFKLRSIAARLILAISLTVAVACAILGTFSILQQRSLTRLALEQQLKLQYDSVIAAIDYEGRAALAVSAVVAALPPVGDAIAKGDRDALGALLGGAMKALKAQGIPLINFQTPPATDFLPRPRAEDVRRRHLGAPHHRGRGAQDRQADRRRRTGPRLARHLRHDADHARRQEPRHSSMSAPPSARNSSTAPSSASASISPCIRSTARHSSKLSSTFGETVVATPDELKSVFDGAPLHRDASSTAIRPRSMSGRSRIMPASRSRVLEVIKDTTEYEAAAAQLAAQSDFRHARHPGRRRRCWRSCSAAACRAR